VQADVLLVAQKPLPGGLVKRVRRVDGVAAAVPVDAGRLKVNGVFTNVLGVSPLTFRPFAAGDVEQAMRLHGRSRRQPRQSRQPADQPEALLLRSND